MDAPCSHGSSNSVSVFAMSRIGLFHFPGHSVLLCRLGDCHLPRVSELWREKRWKLSPRHACGCSMHALRVPYHVFLVLSTLFLRHDSETLSTILRPETHWLSPHFGCRAIQDKHTRLSSDLLKKPLCLLTLRDSEHPQQYVCASKDLESGCMEDLWAEMSEQGDVAGGYLLASRQEHASTPHALLTW